MLYIFYDLRYALILLQIFEWHLMIQIIVAQDKLRVEQIMWNVNMKDSENTGIFVNFKNSEYRQKFCYNLILGIFLLA